MAITEKVKRRLRLPSGYWQIFSFGGLTEEAIVKSAIWISAYFRRVSVNCAGNIISWHDEVVSDVLPVAELVMIEVGCVFHADTAFVYPAQILCDRIEKRSVEVAFTDQNCHFLRRHMRSESGDFLFKNPRFIAEELSNAYLLSAQTTTGANLLIPCVTVLQTFWGRSSNLMHMLLDSRFLDFDRYVLNPKLSYLNSEAGEAFVWLRQWQLDVDAGFLATIAFDPYAIQRGKDIGLTLHASINEHRGHSSRCFAALPPHSDKMTLEVLGLPLKTEHGEYFYIQKIIQSSYKPPFNKVTFDRDNDGRRSKEDDGQSDKNREPINRERAPSIPRREGQSTFEFVSEPPGSLVTEEPIPLGSFDVTFPGIAGLEIEKLEQIVTEFESTEELEQASDLRWAELLSLLPSSAKSSQDIVKTELTSAQFNKNIRPDTNIQSIGSYLDLLVEAIDQLQDQNKHAKNSSALYLTENGLEFSYKHRFPWRASPVRGGSLAFSLPDEINDESFAWLFSDPDQTNRKRAICLEFTFFLHGQFETAYLLDIEGRYEKKRQQTETENKVKSTKIFYIWRRRRFNENEEDMGSNIGDHEFRTIISLIALHGKKAVAQWIFPRTCMLQDRKHNDAMIPLPKLADELFERMQ